VAALSLADKNVRLRREIDTHVDIATGVDPSQTTPTMPITRAASAAAPGTAVAAPAATENTP
jgi:hypothetical protein